MPKLIQLGQVSGGLQLRADINALLESYAAEKVITTVVKTPADPENSIDAVYYTADELLKKIQSDIEALAGGEGGTSLASLEEAINNLTNKEIKDFVRVTGSVVYTEGDPDTYTASLNLGTKEEEGITVLKTLDDVVPRMSGSIVNVYTSDGDMLYTENGARLAINLLTLEFNGIPSVLDVDASAEAAEDAAHIYKAVKENFDFKVYPVGTFTLGDIPSDFVLDNADIETIAYAGAVDKVVARLAKDDKLIDSIKALVGNTAVQAQIQSAIADVNTTISALEAESVVIDKFDIPDSGNATQFILSAIPNNKPVRVVINGITYFQNDTFNVAVAGDPEVATLTWTWTGDSGYDLNIGHCDNIRVIYYIDSAINN